MTGAPPQTQLLRRDLVQNPKVLEAIHREQRREFTDLAAIATVQARRMLDDPSTPAGARIDLIRAVWDRAGLAPPKSANELGADATSLRDLSIDDLLVIAVAHRASQPGADAKLIEGKCMDESVE
jgi:hypothetical protein